MQSINNKNPFIKIYHGYGHAENLTVFGHVLKNNPSADQQYAKGVLRNIRRLFKLFLIQPVSGARLRLQWQGETLYTNSEQDGFFKFEWQAKNGVPAGWHTVSIDCITEQDSVRTSNEGRLFVPHITQYAFVSDIDDTVLVSHSATILKRLSALFFHNPHTRTAFPDVAEHYRQLALARTKEGIFNPFYYVSSSEWNLYNDLLAFFDYNQLPKGVFLLNQIKRWTQLLQTGKTKHEGKLIRIARIMNAFPNQQFVLLGDNSQKDPYIYESVAAKYPKQVFAVYIRNVRNSQREKVTALLSGLEEKGVHTCFFDNSFQAIEHSKKIGLIEQDADMNHTRNT